MNNCLKLFAGIAIASGTVHAAETYPTGTIRLIVPAQPGGASDILGRLLAVRMTETFRQQVVVDNRGGAGHVLATEMTARANPNGHTLLLGTVNHATNPSMVKNLPYDSIRDFAPISLVADSPLVFVVHPSLPVKSIPELVDYARARPGKLAYASSATGSGGHLSVELLKSMTGIDMIHVPYKGAGPGLIDLVAGQVQAMATSPLAAMPHVKAGKLRALAVTSKQRSRVAPDLPTVAESGLKDYHSTLWYPLITTGGTPRAAIARLHAETVRILNLPDVRDMIVLQGADPIGSTPEQLSAFLKSEIERWGKVIRGAGITAQ